MNKIAKPAFTVGIDLGTTHTVVAYASTAARGAAKIQIFAIPQLVAAGEVASLPLLPSVRFHPAPGTLLARLVRTRVSRTHRGPCSKVAPGLALSLFGAAG